MCDNLFCPELCHVSDACDSEDIGCNLSFCKKCPGLFPVPIHRLQPWDHQAAGSLSWTAGRAGQSAGGIQTGQEGSVQTGRAFWGTIFEDTGRGGAASPILPLRLLADLAVASTIWSSLILSEITTETTSHPFPPWTGHVTRTTPEPHRSAKSGVPRSCVSWSHICRLCLAAPRVFLKDLLCPCRWTEAFTSVKRPSMAPGNGQPLLLSLLQSW